MKKIKMTIGVFLCAFVFMSANSRLNAQEAQNTAIADVTVENSWILLETVDGIEMSAIENQVFEGSKLISLNFLNTTERELTFSWSFEDERGIKTERKGVKLLPGENVEMSNVTELKGAQNVTSCKIKLKID